MKRIYSPIWQFYTLARIADKNLITDTKWAFASGMRQPRIAELRQLGRLVDAKAFTEPGASAHLRRACTVEKVDKLYRGLKRIMGRRKMKKSFESILKEVEEPRRRLFALTCIITDGECRRANELIVDMLNRIKAKPKKGGYNDKEAQGKDRRRRVHN